MISEEKAIKVVHRARARALGRWRRGSDAEIEWGGPSRLFAEFAHHRRSNRLPLRRLKSRPLRRPEAN